MVTGQSRFPVQVPHPTRLALGRVSRRLIAAIVGILALLIAPASMATPHEALVLEVDGVIGPAIADYLQRSIADAKPAETGLIILRMDTPGGLDTSMRDIIRAILASPVPVAAYVAPGGARAASAGTYITYACAVAAMAPGTNLGAATPIELGAPPMLPGSQPPPSSSPSSGSPPPPNPDDATHQSKEPDGGGKVGGGVQPGSTFSAPPPADTETRKIINDAEAYIRSLATLNHRNGDWAAKAVRDAVSLPAEDALKNHVIDIVATDIPDLLHQIDGRTVVAAGRQIRLSTAGLDIVSRPPDWRTQVLTVLTNPNIAYILLLIGAYGLFFEFANPGTVAPGTIGGISLLVALFALNMLPVDYAGAGLVLLGLGLMVAEAFIGSFGVIGIGAVIAFAVGSLFMFDANTPGFALSLSVIVAATVVTAGFFLLVVAMLLRSRRRPVVTGQEALIGSEAEAIAWEGEQGRIRLKGEIWQARALQVLQAGMRVRVVGRDGLILLVEPF